ncbi:hypothetical protein [Pantoea sp.]|uniref:hypothetical protein n=1 Tax=Pantoea sp. TaxID=69393 RepID=UPI0031D376B7
MGKTNIAAWFFLLLSFGACAQLPESSITLPTHQGRHLQEGNNTVDVAETPDEHIKERTDDVGYHQ